MEYIHHCEICILMILKEPEQFLNNLVKFHSRISCHTIFPDKSKSCFYNILILWHCLYFDCTILCTEASAIRLSTTVVFCKQIYAVYFCKFHWKTHVWKYHFYASKSIFSKLFFCNSIEVFLEQKMTPTPVP